MVIRQTVRGPASAAMRALLLVIIALGAVPAGVGAAEERIRVALVAAHRDVTVGSSGPLRAAARGWTATLSGPLTIRLTGQRLQVNGRVVRPPLRLAGAAAFLSVDGALVRGDLVITVRDRRVFVVNELRVEDYVRGVVPSEVPSDWPMEALKAQAILARTYVLYKKAERAGADFDVDATVRSQVYGGVPSEDGRASEAVRATAGRVVSFGGRLAFTPYHSTSAGRTEDATEIWGVDQPYLKGVDCSFDSESPAAQWTRRIPLDEIEAALDRAGYLVGPIASMTPAARNRSGRVSSIRLLHAGGSLVLKGEDLRRIIGYQRLPSMRFDVTAFTVNPESRRVEAWFEGGGWGHGVGLCQWGMKALAERGWAAERIIAYYYPGTVIDVVSGTSR
ncbi:MAG: SpoIID/LytB domain-containing protein [Nitrospirota bacterium]